MSYNFKIEKTTAPKAKPADESKLGFGKLFTDHMFIMNYDEGQGRFYLNAKNTGTANGFTVEADDDTLAKLGLDLAFSCVHVEYE